MTHRRHWEMRDPNDDGDEYLGDVVSLPHALPARQSEQEIDSENPVVDPAGLAEIGAL